MAQRSENVPDPNPDAIVGELLKGPEVSAWYAAHSAPTVLTGLTERNAKRWRRYHPAVTVDLVKEGLSVRLESALGPAPKQLAFVVDRRSGKVLRPLPVE